MKLKKVHQTNNQLKTKKALSEMVSYVLLIVIALGLSAGVYSWIKGQLPAENQEKCSEDVTISIINYTCDTSNDKITLNLKNSGLFNINGIYARGANSTFNLAIIMLKSDTILGTTPPTSPEGTSTEGRYDFDPSEPLRLSTIKEVEFNYADHNELTKIQIQPFVKTKNNQTILLCDNVVEIALNNCN